jgi:hypothetical protein
VQVEQHRSEPSKSCIGHEQKIIADRILCIRDAALDRGVAIAAA